jgi:hypothetical protein
MIPIWGSILRELKNKNKIPYWDHGKNTKTHLNGHIRPPKIIDLDSGTVV